MKRLYSIDILKFIGLLCIILAHVSPPKIIFQIRNFDVILMILVSVYLYFNQKSSNSNYFLYVKKRFKRLVLPTWIFLTMLFISNLFFHFNSWDFKTIFSSYILKGGIGYVWIIRIYMLVALLLPMMEKYIRKNEKQFYIVVLLLYIIYEFLCSKNIFNSGIVEYLIAYIIPCILLITITYYLRNASSKRIIIFSIVNLIVLVISGLLIYKKIGMIQPTQYMKYPFRAYYLSYALLCSSILIVILKNRKLVNFIYNDVIGFVSSHSLWVYLWHILFLQIFNYQRWYVNYVMVVICSIIVVFIQNKILKQLKKKNINNSFTKIFEG